MDISSIWAKICQKSKMLFYSTSLKSLSPQQLSNIVVGSVGTLITVEFVLLSQGKNCIVVLNHSQKPDHWARAQARLAVCISGFQGKSLSLFLTDILTITLQPPFVLWTP